MKFRCIKTVEMEGTKDIVFIEGKEYLENEDVFHDSSEFIALVNEHGEDHWWEKSYLKEYFNKIL